MFSCLLTSCFLKLADYAHKTFPNKIKTKVGTPGKKYTPNSVPDPSKSRNHLGLSYRDKNETFHDTIVQILELEAQGK